MRLSNAKFDILFISLFELKYSERDSHRDLVEDSGFLGCDAVLLD